MKANRFKQLLKEGKMPVGHMIVEFGTRGIPRILETADVDFVVIDMEHTGYAANDISDLLTWFKSTAVAPFVRIPQVQYHFIARTLDAGALGIMAPNVRNGQQAREIVNAVKYAPEGDRGVMLGGSLTDFESVNPREFMNYSNENTTVICQIESQEGLENLNDIAGTPGVDVLWVGHFDLSQSLGIPGEFDHPRFLDSLKHVVQTAKEHCVACGIQPRDLDQAKEWMDYGFNVFSYSADFAVYQTALSQGVASLRSLTMDTHNK